MQERRRNKRTELQAKLIIKRLDNTQREEVSIEIEDVSKSGIGFLCPEVLTIGSAYECYLTIWTKEIIHSVLDVVRVEMRPGGNFFYGATFVGMSEMDASRIAVYQTFHEDEQN